MLECSAIEHHILDWHAFHQNAEIVYDEQHRIVSGSASIVDVKYVPSQGKAHSKQTVRESLGAVVLLESKRKGIFLSKTRGLVEYDADMDAFTPVEADDARLTDSRITFTPSVHVVFGDVYGLLHFLHKSGFLSILQTVFPDKLQYERLLAHTLHGVLKDGSRISCDDFIAKSVASFLIPEVPLISLKSDSVFFGFMGADEAKMKFFKAYVSAMRENNPKFGRGVLRRLYSIAQRHFRQPFQRPLQPWAQRLFNSDATRSDT